MAKVEFTAFVESFTKDGGMVDWAIKTSDQHRKQVDGEWVTTGRTFRTVKAAYQVEIDFSQFKKGDRVDVYGTELTEEREYQGKKYYDLIVKAETISLAARKGPSNASGADSGTNTRSEVSTSEDGAQSNWPSNDETPF